MPLRPDQHDQKKRRVGRELVEFWHEHALEISLQELHDH
jgi:hypothetical protein